MALKFYNSVGKGLKIKVKKFWGLIPKFVEITVKNWWVGRVFAHPILNMFKIISKITVSLLKNLN